MIRLVTRYTHFDEFWQVYEQYSAETAKINDARTVIIKSTPKSMEL
jgi:hypothetical protein